MLKKKYDLIKFFVGETIPLYVRLEKLVSVVFAEVSVYLKIEEILAAPIYLKKDDLVRFCLLTQKLLGY